MTATAPETATSDNAATTSAEIEYLFTSAAPPSNSRKRETITWVLKTLSPAMDGIRKARNLRAYVDHFDGNQRMVQAGEYFLTFAPAKPEQGLPFELTIRHAVTQDKDRLVSVHSLPQAQVDLLYDYLPGMIMKLERGIWNGAKAALFKAAVQEC
jgi:hypothetical protein